MATMLSVVGKVSLSRDASIICGAKNAIRPFTVGRRNGLFADTPNGARARVTDDNLMEGAKTTALKTFERRSGNGNIAVCVMPIRKKQSVNRAGRQSMAWMT